MYSQLLISRQPPTTSYSTPQWLFDQYNEEFHFTIDVAADAENAKCPRYYTINDDGLKQDWSGEIVWCNPPYGGLLPWVRKAYEESLKGTPVIMLIPVRSDTRYWHDYVIPFAEVRLLRGKLKFGNHTSTASSTKKPESHAS